MKLHFEKKEAGEISVQVDGIDFATKDYIRMVKEIKDKLKVEVSYSEQITEEEKGRINSMISELNALSETKSTAKEPEVDEDLDDLPF